MSRKSVNMRDKCLLLDRYFFDDLRIKRLLNMDRANGTSNCILFLKAQVEALYSDGKLQPWDDETAEEVVSILLGCTEDEAANMIAAAVKCRLVVRDGETLNFTACWDLP